MSNTLRLFTASLSLLLFASCQTSLEPSGFLGEDDAKMAKNKMLPFSKSWKNPKANLSTYSRVSVRPMRVDQLRELGSFTGTNFRNIGDQAKSDAKELATLATQRFQSELGKSPNRSVSITSDSSKSKDLMYLETNLVQVEPGRPVAQLLNLMVPFVGILNRPSIGIEGRLVDAATGKTLFAFSDRERGEVSFLDLQEFTYYGVQRREIKLWAKQMRKVVEGNGNSLVRDSFVIQPINW